MNLSAFALDPQQVRVYLAAEDDATIIFLGRDLIEGLIDFTGRPQSFLSQPFILPAARETMSTVAPAFFSRSRALQFRLLEPFVARIAIFLRSIPWGTPSCLSEIIGRNEHRSRISVRTITWRLDWHGRSDRSPEPDSGPAAETIAVSMLGTQARPRVLGRGVSLRRSCVFARDRCSQGMPPVKLTGTNLKNAIVAALSTPAFRPFGSRTPNSCDRGCGLGRL